MSPWRAASIFILVLAGAGVAHVAYVNLRADSFARQNLAAAWFAVPPPGYEDLLAVDEVVRGAAREGNLLLWYPRFQTTDPGDVTFASRFYYRAAYTLWPRRAYVADRQVVINDGRDVIRSHFLPDDRWLREHDVAAILEVGRADGRISFKVTPLR